MLHVSWISKTCIAKARIAFQIWFRLRDRHWIRFRFRVRMRFNFRLRVRVS